MKIKLTRRRIIAVAIPVVLLGWYLSGRFKTTAVTSIVLQPRDAVETVLATGRVVGEKTIPLSFIRAGRIAEEPTKDGAQVKAGQILMRQERAAEENVLGQKRTALTTAKLNLDKIRTIDLRDSQQKVRQAKANAAYAADFFARQSELFEQKAVPQLQYDQAKRDKELAESALAAAENQLRSLETTLRELAELQVAQAENDLRRAEIDLRDTVLQAPFDGQVVEHIAHKGEFVPGGQRVITFIPATDRTYVEIQVDESNAGKPAVGQKASVFSPAFPDRSYPAAIERIGSIVDAQRGTFAVRLMLGRLEPELLPESSVSVQIVVGEVKGALLLEQRYVVRLDGAAFVFTARDGRARRVAVKVTDLGNGFFGVGDGLKAGDSVLLPQGLKDGARIKLVPAAE